MRSALFVVPFLLLACNHDDQGASAPQTGGGSTPTSSASAAASDAPNIVSASGSASAPRVFPPIDLTCATNADCVLVNDEVEDHAPQTYACCPSCTQQSGNKTWRASFDAACKSTPPLQCPALGCAQPVVKASCVHHKCAAVTKK